MKHTIAIDISIVDITKTGTAIYAIELSNGIQNIMPNDFDIVILRGGRPLKCLTRRNFFTAVINEFIQLFWLNIQIPLLVLKHDIKVVHFPANMAPFFCPCKVVVTIHDANFVKWPQTYGYWWGIYAKKQFTYAAMHADKVITISENSKKDIVKYFSAKSNKVKVIYHAIRSLPNSNINDSLYGSYILFVGGAYPSKNIPRLIKAYKEFLIKKSINDNYNLVIAGGDGADYQNIRNLVVELGLSECVFFTGHISDAELSNLYKNAKLFVFPSLNEGFGFPPLEAMAYKVPVIASNTSSLPEILGDAALYFDPLSIEDIEGQIELVLKDKDLQLKMGDLGALQASKYSWATCVAQHIRVYREVLNGELILED